MAKILISAPETFIYVDEGFTKTVQQNSMGLGTTTIWKVLFMHMVHSLKSDDQRPLVKGQTLAKILFSALRPFIYVDKCFTKTVQQNSVRLGTTIM